MRALPRRGTGIRPIADQLASLRLSSRVSDQVVRPQVTPGRKVKIHVEFASRRIAAWLRLPILHHRYISIQAEISGTVPTFNPSPTVGRGTNLVAPRIWLTHCMSRHRRNPGPLQMMHYHRQRLVGAHRGPAGGKDSTVQGPPLASARARR